MLTFAHSWVFLLAPLPIIVRWWVPPHVRRRPAVRVPFLPRLLEARGEAASIRPSRRWLSGLSLVAVWLLVVTALARPQFLEPPIERTIPTRDLLLLVDLSGSMNHEDFTNSQGKPVNRLEAVKEVVGEFLVHRRGDRVGLVVFGSSPFLQAPFTTDLDLCRKLLNDTAVGMAGPRTALGDAIGLGIQLFDNSEAPAKTIIALTDGNDTASSVPPVEASRVARDRDITIHTIAVGDPTTVGEEELDTEALKEVAKQTNGDFFLALDRDELSSIYRRLDEIETRDVKTVTHRPRRDLFYWPLLAALAISFAANLGKLAIRHDLAKPSAPTRRLRVNSRTFELEATES